MKKLLLALIVNLAFITCGYSCSCGEIHALDSAYRQSEVIVSGVVEFIDRVLLTKVDGRTSDQEGNPRTAPNYIDYIYVNKVRLCIAIEHKGTEGECELIIYTATSGAGCGVGFVIGELYTVYGYRAQRIGSLGEGLNFMRGSNVIWTNSCTRTSYTTDDEVDQLAQIAKSTN